MSVSPKKLSICFVCLGNICRSPMAEGVLGKLIAEVGLRGRVRVDSCGTGGWHKGERADKRARELASSRGYELNSVARQITEAVTEVYPFVHEVNWEPRFQHYTEVFEIYKYMLNSEEYNEAQGAYKNLEGSELDKGSAEYRLKREYKQLMERFSSQWSQPYYGSELHVIRLGEVAITTAPFALYADYGVRIKARSPATMTLVSQSTGGYGRYLPTGDAMDAGGFPAEPRSFLIGSLGGGQLVTELVKYVNLFW